MKIMKRKKMKTTHTQNETIFKTAEGSNVMKEFYRRKKFPL